MNLLPHRFRSITEKQWRSGQSRYNCAACNLDYGDSVHLALLWNKLALPDEDHYIPASAAALIEGLRGLDDEACTVSITLWAMYAELETTRN